MPQQAADRALIEKAREFLRLTLEEARNALGGAAQEVSGEEYGAMRNLISLESPGVFPGTLYLEADQVRLVRLRRDDLHGVRRTALCAWIGAEPTRLRSRAGKRAQLLVFAGEGIAFSCQGEELDFLELFLPCTEAEYEKRYYRPTAPFIR